MYYSSQVIPSAILEDAKRLCSGATIPIRAGEGIVEQDYFMRDVAHDGLYYIVTARESDGNLNLVYGHVPDQYINSFPQIVNNSSVIHVKWNEQGGITFWAASTKEIYNPDN